jgi:hypothetical protein
LEFWKDVVGYEGIYQVSNFGNVKSLDRYITRSDGCVYFRRGKLRPKLKNTDGYYHLKLCRNGGYVTKRIHRLVAEAFIPNPRNLPEINHIDTDRTNNMVNNLEWCTRYENIQHCLKLGNHVCQTDISGANNPNYGNRTLRNKYKENRALSKEKQSRPNAKNGRAVKVELYDSGMKYIGTFDWIGNCAEYLITSGITKASVDSLRTNIRKAINNNAIFLNHFYKKA